jgi:hypothetical protein
MQLETLKTITLHYVLLSSGTISQSGRRTATNRFSERKLLSHQYPITLSDFFIANSISNRRTIYTSDGIAHAKSTPKIFGADHNGISQC